VRIAISGASGLVGSRLNESLAGQGHVVVRLVRDATRLTRDTAFWNPVTCEIEAERLEGLDVLVHLAGKPLDGQRWNPHVKAAILASRVDGTRLISETIASLKHPPRVLISASATDYYALATEPTGEDDGVPGSGYVSEMCQAWEQATAPAERRSIRVVHIRIPSVLAREGHSILAAFLPLFRIGLGPVLGSGKQLMCFIARDDLVRAIEHLISREDLHGPVNVLAPQPVSNAEFATTLARVLHRPRFLRLPYPVLRTLMGEVAEAIIGGDANLRPQKLLASGFEFWYPDIESAIRHELSARSFAGGGASMPGAPALTAGRERPADARVPRATHRVCRRRAAADPTDRASIVHQ
jgi:uncharacterized protein (TIGR01777 family)